MLLARRASGGDPPQRRRTTVRAAHLGEGESGLPQHLQDLIDADDVLAAPGLARSQRHVLDEPQLPATAQALGQETWRAFLHGGGHGHGIDLDGVQAGLLGASDPGQDVGEPVTASDGGVVLRVQGVDGDVDAVQARRPQPGGPLLQAQAVRGQGDIRFDPGRGPQRGQCFDDLLQVAPHERLATGQADALDPQALDGDAPQAGELGGGQQIRGGQPLETLRGHAVGATQVAAVRDGQAQVAHGAPVAVDQLLGDAVGGRGRRAGTFWQLG